MALLRMKEIREMTAAARDAKLKEVRDELLHGRGGARGGGDGRRAPQPGPDPCPPEKRRADPDRGLRGATGEARAEAGPEAGPEGAKEEGRGVGMNLRKHELIGLPVAVSA